MQNKKLGTFFQVGGSLPAGHPSYISRRCDGQLYDAIKKNKLCTILAPRQMGKSSLKNKISSKLQNEGFTCVVTDASPLRSLVDVPEKWLYSFAVQTSRKLQLASQVKKIWNGISNKSVFDVFEDTIQLMIQKEKKGIVFFIDEVDSVVSKNKGFSESFIRSLINILKRNSGISICILGVTSIYHLLNEKKMILNKDIHHIQLTYLPKNGIINLISGLPSFAGNNKAIVEHVYSFTKGQPYLTQKIFESLSLDILNNKKIDIKDKVKELFFSEGALENDSNLSNCMNRLNKNHEKTKLLSLYSQICNKGSMPFQEKDILHHDLLLSGLALKKANLLVSANPIYQHLFAKNM